jgi:hypothetical protein
MPIRVLLTAVAAGLELMTGSEGAPTWRIVLRAGRHIAA